MNKNETPGPEQDPRIEARAQELISTGRLVPVGGGIYKFAEHVKGRDASRGQARQGARAKTPARRP